MKTIIIGLLLVLMMTINSCSSVGYWPGPSLNELERLFFIFQDTDGNDLLKEIGRGSVSKQTATLHIEYPDERMCPYWWWGLPLSFHITVWYAPRLEVEGFYVLGLGSSGRPGTNTWAYGRQNALPPAAWITYRVQFPALFGSDEVYEIVTYWRTITPDWAHFKESYCYRVVFNGQEFTPTRHYIPRSESAIEEHPDSGTHGSYFSVVTIVLDRE